MKGKGLSMNIIDTHVHLIQTIAGTGAGGELRHIGNGMGQYASGETFRALPEEYGSGVVTAEDILAVMDAHQVEKAVLLQGNYFGFQNLVSYNAQETYPDRFRTAASYDPYSRFRDQIRRHLFEELGIGIVKFEVSTGSGLMSNHPTFPLDGDRMQEEYRYAADHGLIFVVDIGKPGAESWQVDALARVVRQYPSMAFVVCHLLAPSRTTEAAMLEGIRKLALPNVWFDLAALPHNIRPEEYPYETAQRYVYDASRITGTERILFGSDIPSTLKEDSYAHLVGYISESPLLTAQEKQNILYDNAQALFFRG